MKRKYIISFDNGYKEDTIIKFIDRFYSDSFINNNKYSVNVSIRLLVNNEKRYLVLFSRYIMSKDNKDAIIDFIKTRIFNNNFINYSPENIDRIFFVVKEI